jgi:hypothetical protein
VDKVASVYSVGRDDRVVEVQDVPHPEPGAPLPRFVFDEHEVRLLYYVGEAWRAARGLDSGQRVVACRFDGVKAVYAGPPNDEALSNHPLYERGLRFYSAFRVEDSSWVAALRELGWRKDAPAPRRAGPERTHWIITMHDSIFECVAESVTFEISIGTMPEASAALRST